ncbi:MAG: SIS domain-containing protein [Chloroflexi bacterium]|nr:MAG: SIS domain-containing protein [Chloroflexota bacterium]
MIEYFRVSKGLLEQLQETQQAAIGKAADHCAKSIGAGKLVHLFGTGHGSFPALEAFPRSGSLVGFHPIAELPITLLHHVYGDMGVPQYRFLHRQEGYGRAILEGHRLDPADTLVLFSHSGINPVVLDMALMAKEKGMALVGVTSRPHSEVTASRHSSGKKLYEVADVVIDTGAPLGDACVRLDGLDDPVAAVSSMLVMTVVDAMIAETARILVERGTPPHVEVNLNLPREGSARAQNDAGYAELWRRIASR